MGLARVFRETAGSMRHRKFPRAESGYPFNKQSGCQAVAAVHECVHPGFVEGIDLGTGTDWARKRPRPLPFFQSGDHPQLRGREVAYWWEHLGIYALPSASIAASRESFTGPRRPPFVLDRTEQKACAEWHGPCSPEELALRRKLFGRPKTRSDNERRMVWQIEEFTAGEIRGGDETSGLHVQAGGWLAAVVIGLLGLGVSLLLWQRIRDQSAIEVERLTQSLASTLALLVESRVNAEYEAFRHRAELWSESRAFHGRTRRKPS
jgi:hypothetical protein